MRGDDRMEQTNYKFQDVCEIVTDYVANVKSKVERKLLNDDDDEFTIYKPS